MNKGFALLELFAIISLLSLVALIAIPQIIATSNKAKETNFQLAVQATFDEAVTVLSQNIDLSKSHGFWDCHEFEYQDQYPFSSCSISWDKPNPTLVNLKIVVISSVNKKWTYTNKTKAEIKEYRKNYS